MPLTARQKNFVFDLIKRLPVHEGCSVISRCKLEDLPALEHALAEEEKGMNRPSLLQALRLRTSQLLHEQNHPAAQKATQTPSH